MSAEISKGPSGSMSGPVYSIEARVRPPQSPEMANGVLLDGEWRTVSFEQVPPSWPPGLGVPSGMFVSPLAVQHGYRSYESAMALAWWFIAECAWSGVEVRLVEHEFKHSYSVERRAEGEPITTFNARIEKSKSGATDRK